jgi:hypothetical protein
MGVFFYASASDLDKALIVCVYAHNKCITVRVRLCVPGWSNPHSQIFAHQQKHTRTESRDASAE